MSELNLLAVLVGAVASFAFGALWYSPALLLGPWARAAGIDPSAVMGNPARTFGLGFAFTLLSALVLAVLLGPSPPLVTAIATGAALGAGVAGASMGINYEFAGRGLPLLLIDAGFHTLRLAIVGAVLGLWH